MRTFAAFSLGLLCIVGNRADVSGPDATRLRRSVTLGEIPLGRATRVVVPFTPSVPQVCQFPPDYGFALTEISGIPSNTAFGELQPRLRVRVDGVLVASVRYVAPQFGDSRFEFTPPVVIPPGGNFSLEWLNTFPPSPVPPFDPQEFSIGGWTLHPGDI